MGTNQWVKLRTGLVHRAVGDEVFILMADSAVHWLKNPTAVAIWQRLAAAGPRGVGVRELSAELVALFEVEEERARVDTEAFVETLRARGIVDVSEVSAASDGPPGLD